MKITSNTKIYAGTNEIKKVYKGSNIIYQKQTGRLPAEYQEVEYVQSSGTEYINTGINSNGLTNFEIDYEIVQAVQWGAIIGADRVNTPGRLYYGILNNYSFTTNYLYAGNKTTTFSNQYGALNLKTKATYTASTKTLTVSNSNGTLNQTLNYTSIESSNMPMYFFAINRQYSVSDITKSKVYYVKITEGDTLKGEFIPCYRKSDNVIGFYDLVSETFKTNAGSGTFIKGNDV